MTLGFKCDMCGVWTEALVKFKSHYIVERYIEKSWGEWRNPISIDKDICHPCYLEELKKHNAKDVTIDDFPNIKRYDGEEIND